MGDELGATAADHTPSFPPIPQLGRYLPELSPQPMVVVEGPKHIVTYLNPAFARLVGRDRKDLTRRPFAEAVPEGRENGCLALLDRVFGTGTYEKLDEQEHRQPGSTPVYWSYAVWPVLGEDEWPTGLIIQVTDSTETAVFRRRAAAMNEALMLSSIRQHELAEAAESLNARLQEAHDRLEKRVAERTADLARSNEALTAEIARRERAEADRRVIQQRLDTAQEDERRRIARELHDQLGQHLTALGLGLKLVKDETPGSSPARARLQTLLALTDQIGREVHDLALELRPTALDDLGLRVAVANYVEGWGERAGVEVDFHATGLDGDRLPAPVETALYRVVQEALANVFKHAGAKRVNVALLLAPGHVSAVVEDDGRGFDPEAGPAPGGEHRLGLLGMRERAALVGGSLAVESAPGRGTTVIARVPLPVRSQEGQNG